MAYYAAGYSLIFLAPESSLGYAMTHDIATARVFIDKRPHNCEWDSAPLGSKHCHYDREIISIITATAQDGKTPLQSSDDGKTWERGWPNESAAVYVRWTKVDD